VVKPLAVTTAISFIDCDQYANVSPGYFLRSQAAPRLIAASNGRSQPMRYFYAVDQGEGISGGPDIGMQTTQLVTCVGIAMANTDTMHGGLYHYGSQTIATREVAGALIQMINDLKPTHLRVTPAPGAASAYVSQSSVQGTTKEDLAALTKVITETMPPRADLQTLPPKSIATFFWKTGRPTFNEIPDGAPEAQDPTNFVSESKAAPGGPVTVRRLTGDAYYYGINLEKYETKSGDAAAAGGAGGSGPKKKNCCVIL
jgi:hypothetical protein